MLRGKGLPPGQALCPARSEGGSADRERLRPIPWDKVLNVASPDGGVDQFAEALRELVGEAEDAGLELPALIKALREQADAMQTYVDE